ncbi:hypothetical protein SDC9_208616 [bioreactor metagenome]|uniref:Uncharacterized protein n=1 Tax=bioreactor metagenome TaxID=1076179 RepID=A0A645JMP1_9ZZZZ
MGPLHQIEHHNAQHAKQHPLLPHHRLNQRQAHKAHVAVNAAEAQHRAGLFLLPPEQQLHQRAQQQVIPQVQQQAPVNNVQVPGRGVDLQRVDDDAGNRHIHQKGGQLPRAHFRNHAAPT